MRAACCTFASTLLFCIALPAAEPSDGNWPQWRGPNAAGSVDAGEYPVEWTAEENLAWKLALPGRGCSTPIVWGDHIIVSMAIGERDGVVDVDRAGNVRWQTALGPQRKGKHRNGSGSNSSPVTDGRMIVTYHKSGELAGLDFDGHILWQTNLQERFGRDTLWWDVGSSPVLTAEHVVVAVMHAGNSYLAAFDKPTGELAWKVARNYECPLEGDQSYTTPIVIDGKAGQAILVWGAAHVTAHDARDGKLVWSCGGFNPDRKPNWVAVASAAVAGDTIVVPYGRGEWLAGVRLGGRGDVTATHWAWTREQIGSFVPTPAVHQGKVYVLGDRGRVSCLDPQTGKTLWADDLPEHRAKYYASPTIAGGNLYAAREDGVVFVARVDGPWKVLAENAMEEQVIGSPVPLGGRLLLRGERHLFCVESVP